jgi:hypothetical protein
MENDLLLFYFDFKVAIIILYNISLKVVPLLFIISVAHEKRFLSFPELRRRQPTP